MHFAGNEAPSELVQRRVGDRDEILLFQHIFVYTKLTGPAKVYCYKIFYDALDFANAIIDGHRAIVHHLALRERLFPQRAAMVCRDCPKQLQPEATHSIFPHDFRLSQQI